MEETIRKLDSIFLFMFGLGLMGFCVGLAAICVYNRTERIWGNVTLCSAVICVFGFLLRNITDSDRKDAAMLERKRRRTEAEKKHKAFCQENGAADRWVVCGEKWIWVTEDVVMIAESREKYMDKQEQNDCEITFEKIRISELSYFACDRGGRTVIRYLDGSVIKYVDFKGGAVYNFLLESIPEKERKDKKEMVISTERRRIAAALFPGVFFSDTENPNEGRMYQKNPESICLRDYGKRE